MSFIHECAKCSDEFSCGCESNPTRPTADLGEDGDAEWLRNLVKLRFTSERTDIGDRIERIADRLILYREALEALRCGIRAMALDAPGRDALTARIDAVLRSGG